MNVADLALKHIGQRLRVTQHALVIEGTLVYFKPLTTIIHDPTIIEPDRLYAYLTGAELHIGDNTIRLELDATIELLETT